MVQICRGVTLLMCCFAAFELIDGYLGSQNVMQQAAAGALAAATAIIPYVFTKMVEGFGAVNISDNFLKAYVAKEISRPAADDVAA